MMDFDLGLVKVPFMGKLDEEDQIEFERRALLMDDSDTPPIVLDKEGKYIEGN